MQDREIIGYLRDVLSNVQALRAELRDLGVLVGPPEVEARVEFPPDTRVEFDAAPSLRARCPFCARVLTVHHPRFAAEHVRAFPRHKGQPGYKHPLCDGRGEKVRPEDYVRGEDAQGEPSAAR